MTSPQVSEPEPFEPPRRAAAILALMLTVVLGASVLGLLVYRAVTTRTPTRVIIVQGNNGWDGAQLTLEGASLKQPEETSIMPAGNYIVPFFVFPGIYTLHVKSQGVEVYSHQFNVTTQPSEQIDLAMSGATTLPASMPAEADHSSAGAQPAAN